MERLLDPLSHVVPLLSNVDLMGRQNDGRMLTQNVYINLRDVDQRGKRHSAPGIKQASSHPSDSVLG